MLRLLNFLFNGDIHWVFFYYKHQSHPFSLTLSHLYKLLNLCSFPLTVTSRNIDSYFVVSELSEFSNRGS